MEKIATETFYYTPAKKNIDAIEVKLCFPAPYNIGMSALGFLSIYRHLDQLPYVQPERVFSDSRNVRIEENSLVGFSFSFELDIINIFRTLDNLKIPKSKDERDENCPLIFAGGPVISANPEPFVDFFDFCMIGEGESPFEQVTKILYENPQLPRIEKLQRLAEIKGIYIPEFYDINYNDDATIKSIIPNNEFAKPAIQKIKSPAFNKCTHSPITTENTIFNNVFLIEIERGCSQKCHFCIASYLNLPVRYPSKELILEAIDLGLKNTRKIGLLGALITEHPDIDEIFEYIYNKHKEDPIKLTTSSLRADQLTDNIAHILHECNQKQITISVEAGSEKLRKYLNKKLSNNDLFNCLDICENNNIRTIKLYSMIGLPGETQEDINALIELMRTLKKKYSSLELVLSINSFIPKAHTPFERVKTPGTKYCNDTMSYIKKELLKTAKVRTSSAKWDNIQALLSRGDRRLCKLLLKSYEYKNTLGAFNRAFKNFKSIVPEKNWFAERARNTDELLPWDHIHF